MKGTGYLSAVFISLGLLAASAAAERELVDEIIVVVGDKVILGSELANRVQLEALQSGRRITSEKELQELQNRVLDQLISDQLFLIAAQQDTTIQIRSEEIELALEDHISRMAQRSNSEAEFLAALAAEGLTRRELKRKLRPEVENQLVKQRFISRKLYSVTVSRHEVEQFYGEFKDSIPSQPEAAKLAHILLAIEPSAKVEDSAKVLATELRRRILDGADFASISAQYSSLGAGAAGGDLGYVSREDVVEEFGRAAFNLSVGDISGVIRTEFGYHIIKCEGRRDERLKLRHVLLAVQPSSEDSSRVARQADSLLTAARQGADFAELARTYSTDNETRTQAGELGWFAVANLPPAFTATVAGWTTPNEYRGPVKAGDGYHILKLLEYQPAKVLSIGDDYEQIKELARQDKTGRIVDEWIADIKSTTYIDSRLEN